MLIAPPPAVPGAPRRRRGPRLRRIAEMSLAELACRGRHEASKWFERLGQGRSRADVDPRSMLERRAPGLSDPERALRDLREQAPRRFFEGVEDRAVAA